MRHYQDQITDPELKKAIKGFIGQEAHHSREHELMNGFLQERGVDLARLEREILGFMNLMRKYLSPERQLAHTVAVEHFTALMAEEFLLKYDALEEMDPRIAPIWAWHAIEESEHKAVAFDVYKAIGGSEFTRVTEMMIVSVLFPVFSAVHLVQTDERRRPAGQHEILVGCGELHVGPPRRIPQAAALLLQVLQPQVPSVESRRPGSGGESEEEMAG